MALFPFGWGNNQDSGEGRKETDWEIYDLESNLDLKRAEKRKSNEGQSSNKKQKTFRDHQLEWLIRNAVERAIQPILVELAQVKKIL